MKLGPRLPPMTMQHQSQHKPRTHMVEDDLICPITLELPIDPVMALDGRVYERSAITKCFVGKDKALSPMTNQLIPTQLFPAPQHKNLIEKLIEDGVITGESADCWKRRATKKPKRTSRLMQKAKDGDIPSMMLLSRYYTRGSGGFEKDANQAHQWTEKAHQAGFADATAILGKQLATGTGTQKNPQKGLLLLGQAAGQGSRLAAYWLGEAFAKGRYGLDIDNGESTPWLQQALEEPPKGSDLCVMGEEATQLLGRVTSQHVNWPRAA